MVIDPQLYPTLAKYPVDEIESAAKSLVQTKDAETIDQALVKLEFDLKEIDDQA